MSIDPIEFGRVLGRLDAQDVQIKELKGAIVTANDNIEKLIKMAERGKGGLWTLCALGSILGAVIGWAVAYFSTRT